MKFSFSWLPARMKYKIRRKQKSELNKQKFVMKIEKLRKIQLKVSIARAEMAEISTQRWIKSKIWFLSHPQICLFQSVFPRQYINTEANFLKPDSHNSSFPIFMFVFRCFLVFSTFFSLLYKNHSR